MSLLDSVHLLEEKMGMEYNFQSGSVEAINFQANSKFPHELEHLFQQVLDFADNHDQEYGVADTPEKALLKHTKLRELISGGVVGNQFIKIVEKHTRFKIEGIISSVPTNEANICNVWVCILDSTKSFNDIIDTITTTLGYGKDVKPTDKTLHDMLDVSRSLDKNMGHILRGSDWKIQINMPVGIFVVKDIISNNADKCQMTAKEITSVFLHELGHIFSWIEYSADLVYTGYYGNNILRDVTAKFVKNPKQTATEILNYVKKNDSKIDNKIYQKLVTNATLIVKKLLVMVDDKNIEIDPDNKASYNHSTILNIVLMLLIFIVSILFITFGWMKFFLPIQSMINIVSTDATNSNEYMTDKNMSIFERLADEYVSRFGLSKDLNNALLKIGFIYEELSKLHLVTLIYDKAARDSRMLRVVTFFLSIPSNILGYLVHLKVAGLSTGYEELYIRLKRNINNLHDVVKNRHLDPITRNTILDDIDDMNRTLVANKSNIELNAFDKVVKFILDIPDNILVQGGTYLFGSANADKEYMQLFEHLDELLSNKSFYYSASVARLLKK